MTEDKAAALYEEIDAWAKLESDRQWDLIRTVVESQIAKYWI